MKLLQKVLLCGSLLLGGSNLASVYAQQTTPSQTSQTEKRFHTIKKGETLYAITRMYHVTAEEICAANPGLSAMNFQIGAVILIPPASQKVEEKMEQPTVDPEPKGIAGSNCREMHKVKKKETLFSIAQKYHISLEELRDANPETKKEGFELQKKMVLCIPFPRDTTKAPVQKQPTNEELFNQAKPSVKGLTTIRMGVILPLKDGSALATRTLEYYRGLLMAVDSLKHLGLSFEIYTFDAGKTADDINQILSRPILPMLDVIFGPVDATQIVSVSRFSKANKIPMVVPFYSRSAEVLDNPYMFVLNAPDSVQNNAVSSLFKATFANHSLLLVETDQVVNGLIPSLKALYSNVRYAKLPMSENTLLSRLDTQKENIIVLTSSDQKSLNVMLPVLRNVLRAHPELNVKLFGYPAWLSYTSAPQMLEDFFASNTYIYSPFFLNYASNEYRHFSNSYLHNFHSEMLQATPRMAVYGFDCGMYFLRGLQHYGKNFALQPVFVSPLQNKFQMCRVSNWGGLINKRMQFVHYSKTHQLELIEKQ